MANKQNEFDVAVDILLSRQKDATNELMRRFKNTRPFRQEPIPRKEILLNEDDKMNRYSQMTPEMENDLRQAKGDAFANDYIAEMEKMKAGRQ